jgi:hypothetical protein
MLLVQSDFAVGVGQTHLADGIPGGRPRPRILEAAAMMGAPSFAYVAKSGFTGLPAVNRFGWTDSNEPSEPILSAASYPLLHKTQGRRTRGLFE